ncbi:hypothetical protein HS125_16765 [bacterium]|nr:hypothetical protein [bacterium]
MLILFQYVEEGDVRADFTRDGRTDALDVLRFAEHWRTDAP